MDVDNNDAGAVGMPPARQAPANGPPPVQFTVHTPPPHTRMEFSVDPTEYELYIDDLSEHSPKRFTINIRPLVRRPNLVTKMVNNLRSNSSVTRLYVYFSDYATSEQDEESVILPILSVIQERPQTRTLDLSHWDNEGNHHLVLLARMLYHACQNPSIYEFHLPAIDIFEFLPAIDMLVEFLSSLFHNGRKRLTIHLLYSSRLHPRQSQRLANAVANNTTIERLEFFVELGSINCTLAVLEGLRQNSTVKELGINGALAPDPAFLTVLGDVLRNDNLEHLRLDSFNFAETEAFQVIADGVNSSTSLTQLSLDGVCKFDAGSVELLKTLQVTSLGLGCIKFLERNYDWAQCFDQMFGPASTIKTLSLFSDIRTVLADHILSLLATWPGETLNIHLSFTGDIINALATHLPSTTSIQNLYIAVKEKHSLTSDAVTLLVRALENNASIEHLTIDCEENSISDDEWKRLHKYPALNRQLRSCRDTGKLVGAATGDPVGTETGEPVGAATGEPVGAENPKPNEKLWPFLFQVAGSSSTGAASTIRKNEVFEAVRGYLPGHALSQIEKRQDERHDRSASSSDEDLSHEDQHSMRGDGDDGDSFNDGEVTAGMSSENESEPLNQAQQNIQAAHTQIQAAQTQKRRIEQLLQLQTSKAAKLQEKNTTLQTELIAARTELQSARMDIASNVAAMKAAAKESEKQEADLTAAAVLISFLQNGLNHPTIPMPPAHLAVSILYDAAKGHTSDGQPIEVEPFKVPANSDKTKEFARNVQAALLKVVEKRGEMHSSESKKVPGWHFHRCRAAIGRSKFWVGKHEDLGIQVKGKKKNDSDGHWISLLHFFIVKATDGKYYLCDLSSANGSYVIHAGDNKGVRVGGTEVGQHEEIKLDHVELKHGDLVFLGDSSDVAAALRIHLPSSTSPNHEDEEPTTIIRKIRKK